MGSGSGREEVFWLVRGGGGGGGSGSAIGIGDNAEVGDSFDRRESVEIEALLASSIVVLVSPIVLMEGEGCWKTLVVDFLVVVFAAIVSHAGSSSTGIGTPVPAIINGVHIITHSVVGTALILITDVFSKSVLNK